MLETMKILYIFKVGTTFPATRARLGDFDQWTLHVLQSLDVRVHVVRVNEDEPLPLLEDCAGVIITGSHAMVTDKLPWSVRLEHWLRDALQAEVPILGVCYGHQLLAEAAGGKVDYHPQGKEIGTVKISLSPAALADPLLGELPETFIAQVTHSQSVLELPPQAVHLAANGYEPNQAYRLGRCAWGVQFHPEYDAEVMREYIRQQADKLQAAGRDPEAIISAVRETPEAASILRCFAEYCQARDKNNQR